MLIKTQRQNVIFFEVNWFIVVKKPPSYKLGIPLPFLFLGPKGNLIQAILTFQGLNYDPFFHFCL